MHDPELTPLGVQQCQALRSVFPYHAKVTHLVVSPLRRTLYTCLMAFSDEVASGIKVIALPLIQETSDLPCDTGSDLDELMVEFPDGNIDLSLVPEGWNNNEGIYAPEASKIEKRSREARIWLREIATKVEGEQEVHIVVVTHGGFLHYFTEDWVGSEKSVGTGWENTEFRSYEFKSADDENASLEETNESRARRGGSEISMTPDEMRELKAVVQKKWNNDGFVLNIL